MYMNNEKMANRVRPDSKDEAMEMLQNISDMCIHIQCKLDSIESSISSLESDVSSLRDIESRVDSVQSTVDSIEGRMD